MHCFCFYARNFWNKQHGYGCVDVEKDCEGPWKVESRWDWRRNPNKGCFF